MAGAIHSLRGYGRSDALAIVEEGTPKSARLQLKVKVLEYILRFLFPILK